MKNTFTCSICRKTYDKERSDEEAMADSKSRWGEFEPEELCVICDDCFTGKTSHA